MHHLVGWQQLELHGRTLASDRVVPNQQRCAADFVRYNCSALYTGRMWEVTSSPCASQGHWICHFSIPLAFYCLDLRYKTCERGLFRVAQWNRFIVPCSQVCSAAQRWNDKAWTMQKNLSFLFCLYYYSRFQLIGPLVNVTLPHLARFPGNRLSMSHFIALKQWINSTSNPQKGHVRGGGLTG